jgi:hypothetical protein
MLTQLKEIKVNVDDLVVDKNTKIPEAITVTGFNKLNSMVPTIKKKGEEAIATIKNFFPFYEKTKKQLTILNEKFATNRQKAEEGATKREKLKNDLDTAKRELDDFRLINQLSDSDLKSTWLGFGAVMMMVGVTVGEMMLSYTSLYEYFDGLGMIVGVNGGLGLVASLFAMIAGQMLKINLRIQKEIKKYSEVDLTSNENLPQWIQEHPSVYSKKGEYHYKSGFTNFLIFCFAFFCAAVTIFKFITPLQDGNTMAWIITVTVISTNLIVFIAYEFLTYSGLHYPIRLETDKYLRKVARLQEKADKEGTESVEEIVKNHETNKATLKKQYDEEYKRIEPQINVLKDVEEQLKLCKEIVIAFEGKANTKYGKLKSNLQLSSYSPIVPLF